jgi:hypothetical protein
MHGARVSPLLRQSIEPAVALGRAHPINRQTGVTSFGRPQLRSKWLTKLVTG